MLGISDVSISFSLTMISIFIIFFTVSSLYLLNKEHWHKRLKTSALGKKINPRKKGLSLLDPIKRQKDNIKYGIDIWNVYDFMYLNHNKIPQLVVLEIVIPYESDLIIESKSLKLYLNEFYKKIIFK